MNNNLILLIVMTLFAFCTPFILQKQWKKKTGASGKTFFAGMICWLVFSRVLQSMLNSFCLDTENSVGAAIVGTPAFYVLYSCLSVALLEVTGHFLGFRKLLSDEKDPAVSVSFGLGFAGTDMLFSVGVTFLLYFLVAIGSGYESAEANAAALEAINSLTWGKALLTVLEKADEYMLQIGIAMIIFCSVKGKKVKKLYPLAILLRAIAALPASLFQIEILQSAVILEILMLLDAAAIFVLGIVAITRYGTDGSLQDGQSLLDKLRKK